MNEGKIWKERGLERMLGGKEEQESERECVDVNYEREKFRET